MRTGWVMAPSTTATSRMRRNVSNACLIVERRPRSTSTAVETRHRTVATGASPVSDTAPSGRSVARRARRPTACDSPASGRCCSPPAPPQRRSLAGQQHRTRTLRKPTTPNHNQLTYASTRLGPTSSSEKRPTAAGRARDGGNSGLGGGLHDRDCDVLAGEQDRPGVVAQPEWSS